MFNPLVFNDDLVVTIKALIDRINELSEIVEAFCTDSEEEA